MSDTSLNTIIQYGTNAARIAFTPNPAAGSQVLYLWYETDNAPNTYAWDGAAWVQINSGAGSGITELTGDVTAGPGSGSQAATIPANAITTAKIINDAVTYAKIQNVSVTDRILGRDTAGAGDIEELTLSQILDFIGSPAQGDILYRNATVWARLAAGTSGQFLKTQGAAANPIWDTVSGGGGNITDTGTYGSEPGSPASGDLYLPNNAPLVERYSGAAWIPWGPIFPLTIPIDGDFAWINQGAATVNQTNGGISLFAPGTSSAVNWRIRKKAAPATPYVITAAILLPAALPNFFQAGIMFRQSSDGKLAVFSIQANSGDNRSVLVGSVKYTSATVFSAIYGTQQTYRGGNLLWLRIADDGVNRICSMSADGQNWTQFHSVGRTDFLTADEVGFGLDLENTSFDNSISLISWAQT